MRFRLVPKSMTLDAGDLYDLNVTLAEIKKIYGAHQKNWLYLSGDR